MIDRVLRHVVISLCRRHIDLFICLIRMNCYVSWLLFRTELIERKLTSPQACRSDNVSGMSLKVIRAPINLQYWKYACWQLETMLDEISVHIL